MSAALEDRWVRLLSLAFLVGQLCDAITTHVALSSGNFQEANPIFSGIIQSHQRLALLVKMSLAIGVLVAALTKLSEPRRRVVMVVLVVISLEAPLTNSLRLLGVL
ncbi:MAG TPA: DUF5658 family protein [Candidatus Dormibacteraeota bacterium]|nr:DUF5658 family protein [Candidatus Dormibacteraeota bacterium]